MNGALLLNSLLVAATTALAATGLGACVALAALASSPRLRSAWIVTAVLTLALPPFLVTNSWLDLAACLGLDALTPPALSTAGPGPFTSTIDVPALSRVITLLALMFWPVPALLTLGAWQRLDPQWLELEPLLRGWALVRRLLWPAARSTLILALALVAVLALNQFSVPALLQAKVYPAEVWVRFNTSFDALGAFALSWPMIVAPVALLVLWRRRDVSWPRPHSGPVPRLIRQRLGHVLYFGTFALASVVLTLALGVPLAQLLGNPRTWSELAPALQAGTSALAHSLTLAALAATTTVFVASLSWQHRWPRLLWIAFLTPGVLLGILLIVLLNRPPFVAFYQSTGIVLLAWFLRFLAPAASTVSLGLRSVDRDLLDAARLEGARGWTMFRLIHWPQAGWSFVAAWYVVYLLCLWDTETLVLIMPPGGETLALRVFNLLHYGHNGQVNALCLTLLALAAAPWAVAAVTTFALHRTRRSFLTRAFCTSVAIGACLGAVGCSQQNSPNTTVHSHVFSSVQVIGSRGAGLGQFNKPRSLAVDTNDNLYVTDMTGRVQRFSPDGTYLGYWQMPQTDLGKPKGMCRDQYGHIAVVEPHYARVNHFTAAGQLVEHWGQRGTNVGQLAFPRAIAIAPDGHTYVSEYMHQERIQLFRPAPRECERAFGTAGNGPGQFNRAEGIGLDSAGHVYVADSCNHRVQVFESDGRFLRSHGAAGNGPGQFSYPYDIQIDAQGRQYVCEFGNSRIQIFDASDRLLEIIGGPGSEPGQFSNPWSLALNSQGDLYVADSMNHRVQKFIHRNRG